MELESRGIKCKTFWGTWAIIKNADAKIEDARSIEERGYYIQDISFETERLLSCTNYNLGNPDCISCHSISYRYIQEYGHLAEERRNKNTVS